MFVPQINNNQIVRVGCAEAEIIAHSVGVSNNGIPIITMRVRYPRFIHSEVMTHRVFSRNARSSRAVPTAVLLKEEPFVPTFLNNQAGMQGGQVLSDEAQAEAHAIWLDLIDSCRSAAKRLNELNVHKQHANRMLEWFGWIDVLITSTSWTNFEVLRDHPAAQPEIQDLAKAIIQAKNNSVPKFLHEGQWHLPYITIEELETCDLEDLLVMSAARCARISYKPFNMDKISIEEDFKLFDKLIHSSPMHASPVEHQATPDSFNDKSEWENECFWGNLQGWIQHRKILPNECVQDWFMKQKDNS